MKLRVKRSPRIPLLVTILLLTALALLACSSAEADPAGAGLEVMEFDDPAPAMEFDPIPEPAAPAPQLTNPADADPVIESLQEQVAIATELANANQTRAEHLEGELRRLTAFVEEQEQTTIRRLEQFRGNIPQLVLQESQKYGEDMDARLDYLFDRQADAMDHEYMNLLREIRDTYIRYEEAYRQALERVPSPTALQMPFMQAAVDRLATDLELALVPSERTYLMPGLGEAHVFNLSEDDADKVAGFKRRRGDGDSRGIVPGFVNYRFPNEAYRAAHFVEVRYYEPNSEDAARLDNVHGQGLYFKPVIPPATSCSHVVLYTSEYRQNNWQPWRAGPDGCDPRGVNLPGPYIVAAAVNLLQANVR